MYCFLFVAVCSLDGLTNQILFCVLSLSAASQPDDYVAAKSTTTRILRRTARFIQQLSDFFFNIFNICVLAHCLGFNQNMLQNWFMWTCCTWFSFNYQEEALCWYCMSQQLVSTWCEFNDLLRFLTNVLQGSLGLVNKMEKSDFTNRKEPIWIRFNLKYMYPVTCTVSLCEDSH